MDKKLISFVLPCYGSEKTISFVADEIRQLAETSRDTASRIQDINAIVTNAVHNLAENANNVV